MSDTPAPPLTSPLIAPPEPLPGRSGHSNESQALAASSQTSSSPSASDLDEAAKQQFLWQTHSYLNEYARFGDTKAGFAGAAAAALLGALYSAKAHIPLLQTSIGQWPFSNWLIAAALGLLIAAATIAVWTIRPRLGSTQDKGLIFWEASPRTRSSKSCKHRFTDNQRGRSTTIFFIMFSTYRQRSVSPNTGMYRFAWR